MITEERKQLLGQLIAYIDDKLEKNDAINLNFICTHNSRRSHLSQIWAQIAAQENGFININCFSGGTEATALFPMIAETLSSQGIHALELSEKPNPVYAFKLHENSLPIMAFSKKFDHPFNPSSNFAAIMTCSDADENCPVILGADVRIPITYEDPKVSDGGPNQKEVYLERSIQIMNEMDFVFKSLAQKHRGVKD